MKYIVLFLFLSLNIYAVNPIDSFRGKYYIDNGNSFVKKGDYDKAISEYSKAKKLITNSDILEYNIGNVFFANGNYEMSSKAYNNAKDLLTKKSKDSFKSALYYNSGINNIKLGSYDYAITDLIESLKLNPKDKDAVKALEYARKQSKKNKEGQQGQSEEKENSSDQNKDNSQKEKPDKGEKAKDNLPISKEDAKRILDALRSKREEKSNSNQKYKGGGVEKDW